MGIAKEFFEKRKVQQTLKIYGSKGIFYNFKKNEFGENTKEKNQSLEILGLMHTVKGYVTRNNGDSAVTNSKDSPMFLCIYDDAVIIVNSPLDWFFDFAGKTYKVSGIDDVAGGKYALDVSLQEVRAYGNKKTV